MNDQRFYVYYHVRPDTGDIVYVGKGSGDRAYSRRNRNRHWRNIEAKLAMMDKNLLAVFVFIGLSEGEAFDLERNEIARLKGAGVALVNYTDGGEGVAGFRHSPESRDKMRESQTGKKRSAEAIEKQRLAMLGRNVSQKTREKIRASNIGKVRSAETRAKLKAAHRGMSGKTHSAETRERMRNAQLGGAHSEVSRKRMSASQLLRFSDPAEKARRSMAQIALWKDPAYREMMAERRSRRNDGVQL